MAGERSDLGKIFITPGGDYDATVTYETLTMVKYNNSLYLTLRTVTGVTPSDDRVNYLLMAQGFTATRLESITATDVQGLVTEPGDEMPAQTLINAIADRVANQLVTNSALTDILGDYILKSAIANNLSITEEGKVLDARQGKALNDAKADKSSVSALTAYSSAQFAILSQVSMTVHENGIFKYGHMCFGKCRISTTTNGWASTAEIFRAPEGFRPAVTYSGSGYENIITNNVGLVPVTCYIASNGNVGFSYSTTQNTSQFSFVGVWWAE